MNDSIDLARQHVEITRRYFARLGVAGMAGLNAVPAWAAAKKSTKKGKYALSDVISRLEYLTKAEDFNIVGRGDPKPHTLSPEQRLKVGLDPKTWKLEVLADPESDAQVERPLTLEAGTAFDWDQLMAMAEKHAVRFMKVMTCTNIAQPCGMGLWEGVPLRHLIWQARPVSNVRRVFYYGYHNDDAQQRFQSSLPIGRVLEDPPGEEPVILCYKLNGKWLTPESGAPVRMIVPDAYGNKSVKWLQRILLTNQFRANDTYAEWNNDTVSHTKTYARLIHAPAEVDAGQDIPITGLAQVGMSGLAKVQWSCLPKGGVPADDDSVYPSPGWHEAEILPPPKDWGGGLPDGKLPPNVNRFSDTTHAPLTWPLRDTIVHWAALLPPAKPGQYELRCRTIDANGYAQPMPRPLPKSGNNRIQTVPLEVKAATG